MLHSVLLDVSRRPTCQTSLALRPYRQKLCPPSAAAAWDLSRWAARSQIKIRAGVQTHVKEGELLSQCGRRYPIEDAIPNMLLKEDEVAGEPAAEADAGAADMTESESDA